MSTVTFTLVNDGFTTIKTLKFEITNENKIVPHNDTYYSSLHMLNMIKKNKSSYDETVLQQMTIYTHDLFSWCYICKSKLPNDICQIAFCEQCSNHMYMIPYDNTVTDSFKKDQTVFWFILLTSLTSFKQHLGANQDTLKRFNPYPTFLPDTTISFDEKYYIDKLEIFQNDRDLSNNIAKSEYMFLRWIILTNNMNLSHYNTGQNTETGKSCEKNNVIFTLSHPYEKYKKFQVNDVFHLFHGSPNGNWYSIMRNGLKNYSNTKYMTTGAAYGAGIYLAPDLMTSYSYCGQGSYHIMGVVQLLNKENYTQSSYYVVPNEDDVLLKYIILIRNQNNLTKSSHKPVYKCVEDVIKDMQIPREDTIEEYLIRTVPHNMKINIDGMKTIVAKRLTNEMNNINKDLCTVQVSDNIWNITLANKVEINIIFSIYFPTNPPSITVKKLPNNKQYQMIVNEKYMDPCIDIKNWVARTSVAKIINHLVLVLLSQ